MHCRQIIAVYFENKAVRNTGIVLKTVLNYEARGTYKYITLRFVKLTLCFEELEHATSLTILLHASSSGFINSAASWNRPLNHIPKRLRFSVIFICSEGKMSYSVHQLHVISFPTLSPFLSIRTTYCLCS